MSDVGFAIAGSGLQADQAAMDAIADNLSNVNTSGYQAEQADLTTAPSSGTMGIGSGVDVLGITQASDAVLSADTLSASSASANSSALEQVLQTVENAFPEPSSNGLSSQLTSFWSGWNAVTTDPSEVAPRTAVIDQAQDLVSTLNQASSDLTQTLQNTNTQISTTVTQVNSLLSQVATLNQSIVSSIASGSQPNAMIDQQNSLINQLGQDIGITTQPQANGAVNISVGGFTLVQGDTADTLSVKSSGTPATTSIVSNASSAALPVTSGQLAGLLTAVNVNIPSYQSELDQTATNLANTVNNQLGQGWDASGNSDVAAGTGVGPNNSAPLFVLGSGSTGAAATISINAAVLANPQLLAAASTATNGANDGSNAGALAELGTAATGPDLSYQNFITNLGTQVQTATTQSASQTSLSQSLQASLQSVTGVDTDQQTVQMLGYQQAYQASAKVISTIDTMMQSLLAAT